MAAAKASVLHEKCPQVRSESTEYVAHALSVATELA